MIKITLPDGSTKEFDSAVTPLDVARSISEGLARNTISAMVNGTQVETTTPITEDSTVQLLTWNDDLGKKAFWHSSAHLLAQAISRALFLHISILYEISNNKFPSHTML